MNNTQHKSLLALAWRYGLFERGAQGLQMECGTEFELIRTGSPADYAEVEFTGAEIGLRGDVSMHGNIRVDPRSSMWHEPRAANQPRPEGVILHVVGECDTMVMRDNRQVPTFVLQPLAAVGTLHDELVAGRVDCYNALGNLEGIYRREILSRAMADRLRRKSDEIIALHRTAGEDWNRTAYVVMLRSLGMGAGKEWFGALAESLPLSAIAHCRGERLMIEALLLGQAGLLDVSSPDARTLQLQDIYVSLRRELRISPLSTNPRISGVRPTSRPTPQLQRMAIVLSGQHVDQLFETVAREADTSLTALRKALGMSSSEYSTDRIDRQIINFVIPLIVAYARVSSNHELQDRVTEIYETLPPEYNTYTRRWAAGGTAPENAFDSQAMIQLSTEFCAAKRCAECPLGAMMLVRCARE